MRLFKKTRIVHTDWNTKTQKRRSDTIETYVTLFDRWTFRWGSKTIEYPNGYKPRT